MRFGVWLAWLCIPAAAWAGESEFLLQLDGESVAYQASLNGNSVMVQGKPSAGSSIGLPVNKYLKVGTENTLEVHLTAREGTGKLSVTLKDLSGQAPLLEKQTTFAGGPTETWRFQVPPGVVLAQQHSIFPEAAPSPGSIKIYTQLITSAAGLKGVLRLNGVVVSEASGMGGTESGGSEMTNWLMPGENRFELEVKKLPAPSAPRPWYRFSLHGLAEPGFAGDENKLYGFDWPTSDAEAKPMKQVFVYSLTAPVTSVLWSKARRLEELSAGDKAEIAKLVSELTTALQHKDTARLTALWRFRMEDLGRAFGPESGQLMQMMEGMLKRARLTFVPPAQLHYTRVAGDKVVQVTGPTGEAPVGGTVGKDGKVHIPVFVAKLDGVWTLVR